ncbi:MAG: hypothetical protein M3405_17945 [Acidobacteriota bacterium]|jgi:O-antigen/teichoic acid export membrane protein|nr:hypothetical protein [Acidobacteriota bacterium]
MKEPVKVKSLKSQSAWLLIAKIIGFTFSFMLPLIVVRVLNLEQIGLYRLAFIVVTNASAILPLGFGMSAYYYLSRDEERKASAIFNIVLFNFVMGFLAFLVLFFYPQLLGNIFHSTEMTRLAPVIYRIRTIQQNCPYGRSSFVVWNCRVNALRRDNSRRYSNIGSACLFEFSFSGILA